MTLFDPYKLRKASGKIALLVTMAVFLVSSAIGQGSAEYAELHRLSANERLKGRINKGEIHQYLVTLKKGDLYHLKAVQNGVNVVLAIAINDDKVKVIKQVDQARESVGTESLIYIAEADGEYRIGVFAFAPDSPNGSYSLQNTAPFVTPAEKLAALAVIKDAEAKAYNSDNYALSIALNRKAVDILKGLSPDPIFASTYFSLGNSLFSNSEYEEAIEWYQKAIPLYRQFKNDADEAIAFGNIGGAFNSLKRYTESNRAYEEAIAILIKRGDRLNQALCLAKIGENLRLLQDHPRAISNLEKAAVILAELKESFEEADVYSRLAGIYFELSDFEKSAMYFRRSGDIFRQQKDATNQALMLSNLGLTLAKLERIAEARAVLGEALKLVSASPSPRTETAIRQVLGEAYFASGSATDALAQYQLALKSSRLVGDPLLEISSLRGVGSAYSDLGDYPAALKHHFEALAIAEKINNDSERASELGNIALIHSEQGKYDLSFEKNLKALAIYQRLKDKRGQRLMLNNIGIAYLRLGSLQKAEEYLQRSAALGRELKNEREMSMNLGNLAAVYTRLKQYAKAIPYFEESMPLFKKFNNHRFSVIIGYYYGTLRRERGEIDKAIRLHQEAVETARKAKMPKYEARARVELGLDYLVRRNPALAIVNFQEALIIARSVQARDEESAALAGLMQASIQKRNAPLAIFYGKQSINLLQAIRGEIEKVEKDIQENYVKDNEQTYRQLADTLIAEGRLPEAQQVLGMLKEEELSGFVRRDSKEIENLAKRADLRANERTALEKYSSFSTRVTGIAAELAMLDEKRRGLPSGQAFSEQARYDELNEQIKTANTAFRLFLEKELAAELGIEKKREIDADRALQGKLRQWGSGTVALATMVGDSRYRVILTTPNAQVDGKTEITAANLNQKIFQFREALLNPAVDPRPLGKELYDILVRPIEKDLAAAGATTLLWSLDGTLRYIPVAALWDGQRYLVEKYQNVVLTSTTRQSLQAEVNKEWSILGAGVTKASKVTDAGSRTVAFDELKGVVKELSSIVGDSKASASGVSLLDSTFTEDALKRELGQLTGEKRKYNVVHFATHFRLGSDTADSFLLLGNDKALTLADVADSPEMNLTDVELVTLSACNTGFGAVESKTALAENNGKEVDSLAQFIELRGAKSVMATLWAVIDDSTALLMGEFYRLRKVNPSWTKSETLRQAQLAILTGAKKGEPGAARRSDPVDMGDSGPKQPAFVIDPAKPFAHPHYWAPFVMIGNWR